ncbi:CopG family transcriptional regulator [Geoalkalibacter sp.]|uniref:ribbon-helix-helix domain-containing protein n=1 Tax=Geoalkalibacter sp. TaxID=3041440 RepID=UPI00272EC75C|nr:CopG family transcriptional regulator [Geoalkalibacter sp.]
MRTTLDLEEDVLAAAKELARRQKVSTGQIISRLVREALAGRPPDDKSFEEPSVGGFRPFPGRGRLVTNELINDLRDREGV